jgi:hypothetical protein
LSYQLWTSPPKLLMPSLKMKLGAPASGIPLSWVDGLINAAAAFPFVGASNAMHNSRMAVADKKAVDINWFRMVRLCAGRAVLALDALKRMGYGYLLA